MKRIFGAFCLVMILNGCASNKKRPSAKEVVQIQENEAPNLQKEVKKSFIYSCQGCIAGSSSVESIEHDGKEAYFLEGVDHLNLQNRWFDLPVVYNDEVQKWIEYFQKKGRKFFKIHGERAGRYTPMMSEILASFDLPRDLIFLAMAESGFRNDARSWASAVGPWQFIKSTAKNFNLKVNYTIDERRDPLKSTIAASKYLSTLYEMFGDWKLAKAGYNAGEGKIDRAIKRYHTKDFWEIAQGRYLKSETKNYVPKIYALAIIGKNLESFGFDNFDSMDPLDFDEITVPANTDLYKVAEIIDADADDILYLNPELLRWYTPSGGSYRLRVPLGTHDSYSSAEHDHQVKAVDFQYYKIKWGGQLSAVASKYGIPVEALSELNGISGKTFLSKGKYVKLPFRVGHSPKSNMYADLFHRPRHYHRKQSKRVAAKRKLLRNAKKYGKLIQKPQKFYTVKKGDTLWDVSKKTGVSINTLVRSNYSLAQKGVIRPGDKLAIR